MALATAKDEYGLPVVPGKELGDPGWAGEVVLAKQVDFEDDPVDVVALFGLNPDGTVESDDEEQLKAPERDGLVGFGLRGAEVPAGRAAVPRPAAGAVPGRRGGVLEEPSPVGLDEPSRVTYSDSGIP